MSFGPILQIQVGLDFGRGAEPLGKLALRDRKIYFEYEVDFISRNLNVSPFQLPLKSGVQDCFLIGRCEHKVFCLNS